MVKREGNGRLVVALQPLIGNIPVDTIGFVLDVFYEGSNGIPYSMPRYDIFFSCGKRITLTNIGLAFDFID